MVPKNKRAQGMSTNTIILLILGIVVLVALVWGFSTGWSSLRNLVDSSNVDDVAQDCSAACAIDSVYSYCSAQRTLKVKEDNLEVKSTCVVFSTENNFKKYGISSCPNIDCDLACEDIVVDGKTGDKTLTSGSYDVSALAGESCFIN